MNNEEARKVVEYLCNSSNGSVSTEVVPAWAKAIQRYSVEDARKGADDCLRHCKHRIGIGDLESAIGAVVARKRGFIEFNHEDTTPKELIPLRLLQCKIAVFERRLGIIEDTEQDFRASFSATNGQTEQELRAYCKQLSGKLQEENGRAWMQVQQTIGGLR